MRNVRVWRTLLGVEKTVVEGVEFEGDGGGQLIVRVRAARAARSRCGICRRRCGRYDAGEGRRRWRGLDAGTIGVFVEADAPRVRCAEHGVVVAHVPWARHGAGHTLAFDETVAWLVTQCSKSAVTELTTPRSSPPPPADGTTPTTTPRSGGGHSQYTNARNTAGRPPPTTGPTRTTSTRPRGCTGNCPGRSDPKERGRTTRAKRGRLR